MTFLDPGSLYNEVILGLISLGDAVFFGGEKGAMYHLARSDYAYPHEAG